jgi:hypothetical protein
MPVLKNASTTYANYFKNLGWIEIEDNKIREDKNLKLFGHIQNPDIRHTKGLTQWLYTNKFIDLLDDDRIASIICSLFLDEHTYSLEITFSDLLDRIHWIPLDLYLNDTLIPSTMLTNEYFRKNDLPFTVNNSYNKNIEPWKQEYYDKITKIKQDSKYYKILTLPNFLQHDRTLWNGAINRYNGYIKNGISWQEAKAIAKLLSLKQQEG